jgi:hypothetical protein
VNILDGLGVENMRVKWWKQVVLKANWKIAIEAFQEGYHSMQTHPQLMQGRDVDYAEERNNSIEYLALEHGHARYGGAVLSVPSGNAKPAASDGAFFLETSRLLASGQDAMVLDREVMIFEGLKNKVGLDDPNFERKALMALYEYADGADIPMPPLSEHMKYWGGPVFVFPNFEMLPLYGNSLAYRVRPYQNDPEMCLFDVWSLVTHPRGREPGRAELLGVFEPDDAEHWGLIPRQDFANIERQQKGLRSRGFESMRFSTDMEKGSINMHEEIDRTIASHMP